MVKNRKYLCRKCFPLKHDILEKRKNDFINFIKKQNLFEFSSIEDIKQQIQNSNSLIKLKCKKCGKINKKTMRDYEKGKGCTCSCTNTLKSIEQFKTELPDDIEIIGEYKGAFQNTLFKHKICGFIWEAKPHNILNGKGCPKCNKKESKGEQKIEQYLKAHNIQYIHEYGITVEGHNLRIDFYFPQWNFGIEYNGIQHYYPIKHFGGEQQLKKQQYYDELKIKYYNIITISYEDYENINSILTLVFNDYLERE